MGLIKYIHKKITNKNPPGGEGKMGVQKWRFYSKKGGFWAPRKIGERRTLWAGVAFPNRDLGTCGGTFGNILAISVVIGGTWASPLVEIRIPNEIAKYLGNTLNCSARSGFQLVRQ